jgi:hypothetical protein
MMWFEIVILVLLALIGSEVGWLIFHVLGELRKSQETLAAIDKVLAQSTSEWLEFRKKITHVLTSGQVGIGQLQSQSFRSVTAVNEDSASNLLRSLNDLSLSISKLREGAVTATSDDLSRRLAEFAEIFENSVRQLQKAGRIAVEDLREESQQFLKTSSNQSRALQDEIRNLTDALIAVRRQGLHASSSTPSQHVVPARPQPQAERVLPTSRTPGEVVSSALQPTTGDGPTSAADRVSIPKPPPELLKETSQPSRTRSAPISQEFARLKNWVTDNLEQIMNRSLNQWSKPEELLRDAPAGLRFTVRLLDLESKLMLVGVLGASQYLVLALPGGHLGDSYTGWFSTPKGVNRPIERTRTPAVVDTSENGYQVLERGVIQQE